MSANDSINAIEDEPYQGLYRGAVSHYADARDHLPDRFDLADILRTTREARGWTLEQMADMTRVRRAYLEAFEQAAYDILPPRAFAIGYVKAYAKALGLDEETLADMYKRDVSEPQGRLHAPSGASLEDVKPNYRMYIVAAVGLVAAVVIWNVVQRKPIDLSKFNRPGAMGNESWSVGQPLIRDGVVYVSKPKAAPQDQDVPPAYVTPGLEAGFQSIEAAHNQSSAAPVPVQDVLQGRKAFNPRGAIYGSQPENSSVTIQATKSVNLVMRGSDGTVYFAHQLGAGEAFRLPANSQQDLLIDVSDTSAFEMYYNGEYAGAIEALVTPVGKMNARAAQLSAQLDARQAAAGQVSDVYRSAAPAPQRPVATPKSTAPLPYLPTNPAPAPKPAAVKPVIKPKPAVDTSSSAAPAEAEPAATAADASQQ
ncbi:helix-turn-helix domain-containing protein [Asticcacaulis solisilvae]|uniref:helix-turn-helix domain-containing protein n=1 Tax=Asticcacaulis solisilvae TaxID=1217274 RepID=UPI003FD7B37D